MAEMTDADLEEIYFKGRGKRGGGKGFRRSTGKGRGRRRNPVGSDGNVMRCGICNSDTHFRAQCPQNQNTNHSHGFAAVPAEQGAAAGPLGDLLYAFVTDREGDAERTEPPLPPPPPTYSRDCTHRPVSLNAAYGRLGTSDYAVLCRMAAKRNDVPADPAE